DLVDVAPAPVLARLCGADDRVPGLVRVSGRVPVGRRVAAADLPASHAHPQVQPPAPCLQALLAAVDPVGQLGALDPVEMRADGLGQLPVNRRTNARSVPTTAHRPLSIVRDRVIEPAASVAVAMPLPLVSGLQAA